MIYFMKILQKFKFNNLLQLMIITQIIGLIFYFVLYIIYFNDFFLFLYNDFCKINDIFANYNNIRMY